MYIAIYQATPSGLCTEPSPPAVLIARATTCGPHEYEFYAICSETQPSDCYFGNSNFSNYRWFQGKHPRELAEEVGAGACFEWIAPYSEEFPYPDCCPDDIESMALLRANTAPSYNTGTELKKLISWFPIPGKTNCKSCQDLEQKMNYWGPDMCEEKKGYIISKLRLTAKERNLPFIKPLVELLVNKAIKNSRKQQ